MSLRTRVRYDDHGSFTLTISGPAQHLPVIQAGIEAKKAELQQQREADAAAPNGTSRRCLAAAPTLPRVSPPLASHGLGLALLTTFASACTSDRIGSQLEAEATFACADAIEKRLEQRLPNGWKFSLDKGDDEAVVEARAPDEDRPGPPDYTCHVVQDRDTKQGVRVVDVVEGRRR